MRDPERSVWALAAGSACVFAISVVSDRLPWQVAFAAVMVSVVAWGWCARPAEGAAIGAIGWLCVTGFDVHQMGTIEITSGGDVVRAAVLVLSGGLAASVHAVLGARRRYRRASPVRDEPGTATLGSHGAPPFGSGPKSKAGIGRNG